MPNKIKISRKAPATKKRHPKRFTETELNNMKLHQLLGVAIKDACILKKSKKWKFDMDYYLRGNGVCSGCLAGAVLHQQLGLRNLDHSPTPHFASALDSLRVGSVSEALWNLSRPIDEGYPLHRDINQTKGFTLRLEKDLRKLQADLKKADL